jgi:mRNA guanylyltransferase
MDLKKLELSYGMEKVFEDMARLKHKSDGIIFTASEAPYTFGTCEKMLVSFPFATLSHLAKAYRK